MAKRKNYAIKLKIYQEPLPGEQATFLRLMQDDEGVVDVVAVDSDGEVIWNLVGFNSDGTISRYGCISTASGFQIDEEGRIKLDKDD